MLNHIVIMGRLVRDPELRRTGTGATQFGVCHKATHQSDVVEHILTPPRRWSGSA